MQFLRSIFSLSSRRAAVAEEALQHVVEMGNDDDGDLYSVARVLLPFDSKLSGPDDYTFLIRELGNRGECSKAIKCFEFAIHRVSRIDEKEKVVCAMISTLGRFGKVELAQTVFEDAMYGGYGNTVDVHSALINAYARSGNYYGVISVAKSMIDNELGMNLIAYNCLIDACAKEGKEFTVVMKIFDAMVIDGVQPDLFTYNTLLDVVCKSRQMDLAIEIMSEMPAKNILPNVVTYSTVIDGYAKADRLDDALSLFNEIKYLGIGMDRVLYNTLLSIYAKIGRFVEALDVFQEMESAGIKKDIVTYNALLCAYGKQGKYDEVRRMFAEMKAERVYPNLLTCSTLIDVYSKGGLYQEAMEVFRDLKRAGLKADVVLYSAVIDVLCKKGLVEAAVSLLDEMMKDVIRPNVATYNSIIDAIGCSAAAEYGFDASVGVSELQIESSSAMAREDTNASLVGVKEENQILKLFGQLAAEQAGRKKRKNSC